MIGRLSAGRAWLARLRRRLPPMTLRRRLVIAFVGLVIVAVTLVGAISYSATVSAFRTEMDRTLISAATTIARGGVLPAPGERTDHHSDGDDGDNDGDDAPRSTDALTVSLVQHISPTGAVSVVSGPATALAIDSHQRDLARANAAGAGRFDERSIGNDTYRVYTLAEGGGHGATVVGLSTADARRILARVAINTVLIGLAVVLAAVLAAWWIARQITRRLGSLTRSAEHVADTGDLDVAIEAGGRDEVARLADAMRTMLAELAQSRDTQHRLIEDAGHELRTPITSLRTNASVLRRLDALTAEDRQRLLNDVDGELRELTTLVNELVELATDSRADEPTEPVLIRSLLTKVAAQTQRRTGRSISVDADDTVLTVQPRAIERAVANLLANAAKFDPNGTAPIQVTARGGTITVSDRGPGVPVSELDTIFDRFHRADTARGLPGSGLGLAIVRDIAARHGGTAVASARPGGGLTVTLTLSDQL